MMSNQNRSVVAILSMTLNYTDPSLPVYQHPTSGRVAPRKDWFYVGKGSEVVNAVDLEEVFEVVWDYSKESWVLG